MLCVGDKAYLILPNTRGVYLPLEVLVIETRSDGTVITTGIRDVHEKLEFKSAAYGKSLFEDLSKALVQCDILSTKKLHIRYDTKLIFEHVSASGVKKRDFSIDVSEQEAINVLQDIIRVIHVEGIATIREGIEVSYKCDKLIITVCNTAYTYNSYVSGITLNAGIERVISVLHHSLED